MILQMDSNVKKKLQKVLSSERKSTSILNAIVKFILIASIAGGFAYGILNILIPDFGIVTINGIDKKDYFSIFYNAIEIIIFGVVISLMLRALRNNLSSKDSNERVDEELLFINNTIRYTFRIKFQSNGIDRNVIIIPLSCVSSATYTEKSKMITFKGKFSSEYVKNYSEKVIVEPNAGNLSDFIIYDYFKPSLLNELKRAGLNIL